MVQAPKERPGGLQSESSRVAGRPGRAGSLWRAAAWLILCLACVICMTAVSTSATAEVHVVATTSDVAAVIEAVGGERVDVTTLAKGYMDPHYLEAKPSYVAKLRRADMLVYNGLQLEIGWLPLILQGARNGKIALGTNGHVQMSRGLEVLEVPTGELSREMGDVHPEGNPHYTLDPRNVVRMAHTAEEALARIDPDGATVYAANRERFAHALEAAIDGWEARLAPYRGQKIVCYHKQWEYLLHWLGIEPIDYIENKPGVSPSPRHVEQLERTMQERRIPVLLASTFIHARQAKRLAERTGAQLLVLPAAVRADDHVADHLALFGFLVDELEKAFRRASG